MQVLVFHLGNDRYGLPTRRIKQILPLLEWKTVPQAPPHVAGLIDLHGKPVPVLDVPQLVLGRAAHQRLDTRIVLVDCRSPEGGQAAVGLLLEQVSGVERVDPREFVETGIDSAHTAPYLGKVATGHGMLQLIEPEPLLSPALRDLVFAQQESAP